MTSAGEQERLQKEMLLLRREVAMLRSEVYGARDRVVDKIDHLVSGLPLGLIGMTGIIAAIGGFAARSSPQPTGLDCPSRGATRKRLRVTLMPTP